MKTLLIVQIEPPQDIQGGDFYYRTYAPGVCMAQEEGVYVVNLTGEHRLRKELAESADILILKNICDPDYFPIIGKRKSQKKPTVYEIADDLLSLQPWNPVYSFWKHLENRTLFQQLAKACDGLQFTCNRLQEIYGRLHPNRAVFKNQILEFPAARKKVPRDPDHVVIGWGGSHGHMEDLSEIAGPLVQWIGERPGVSLHLMCSEEIFSLFENLPRQRKKRIAPGSVGEYYDFLSGVDVGLIPLKDTAYNRSRSDVKFLEYSAAGVVSVVRRMHPYLESVTHGKTGLFFDSPAEMIASLNRLIVEPGLIERISQAARGYVLAERRQPDHVHERVSFYLETGKDTGLTGYGSWNVKDTFERWSGAERALTEGRYLHLLPGRFEDMLVNGLVAMQVHKEEGTAREMFAEAAHMEPANYLPLLFGSSISGNPVESLVRALKLEPDSLRAWVMMGDHLGNAGKVVEAFRAYEAAAKICPEYTASFSRAVDLLRRIGQEAEAEELLTRVRQMTAGLVC
jgi:glycosyltransferase involved in cell wall biosynthesis